MRAAIWLAVVQGAVLAGCPRREEAAPASAVPMGSVNGRAEPLRCSLEPERLAPTPEPLRSPWLLRGPDGPRLVARATSSDRLFWRDARGDDMTPSALSIATQAFAWTGRGFVGADDAHAAFTDPRFGASRPLRRLPIERAVSVSTAAREGAALVAWLRPAREGAAEADPWTAMVGPGGELLADPQPLTGAPWVLRTLSARWDFGRFVVEGQTVGRPASVWSWVLDPDGRSAWSGAGRVVCPVSGCFRVDFAGAMGGQTQALRLVPLADPSGAIPTTIYTNGEIAALAVSGSRVLVLNEPLAGERGCAVHVFDVGRRDVPHESASDHINCAPGSVLATPQGFAILEYDPEHGAAVRALTCGDGA